jgi:tyrosyl-tRNA synthetase
MDKKQANALPVDEQLDVIRRGAVDIIPEDSLREKLQRSIDTGNPLIIKQGFDPTAPDIHLGHTVGLRKLRQFQDLGHQVVFLIGDFTGLVGDPSGQSQTRRRMSREDLLDNAETYTQQAYKILDPKKTTVEYNSRWLAKFTFIDVLELAATQTIAQLLERDDFEKRYKQNKPISLLEFIYPLAQGYDSVALNADVELGGTEQKFNLLMAREIQRSYGQEPQVIVTLPILVGTDGVEKMSKSLGNYIGITEPPEEIFGKTMSIPDSSIRGYFEHVSTKSPDEIREIGKRLQDPATNPSHLKRELARDIIAQFHDEDAAGKAEAHFDMIHVRHETPEDVETIRMKGEAEGLWIVKALTESGLSASASHSRRMIQQGGVSIDGAKVTDIEHRLAKRDDAYIVKMGKRKFIGIRVT